METAYKTNLELHDFPHENHLLHLIIFLFFFNTSALPFVFIRDNEVSQLVTQLGQDLKNIVLLSEVELQQSDNVIFVVLYFLTHFTVDQSPHIVDENA